MGNTLLRFLWFSAFVIVLALFIAYSTLLPLFGAETEKAWQWLLPNLLPPLGIVFGIDFALKSAGSPAASARRATSAGLGWSAAVSLLYLAALLFSVVGVLFVSRPLEFLSMANYWLSPLLAFATAMLGARFVSELAGSSDRGSG